MLTNDIVRLNNWALIIIFLFQTLSDPEKRQQYDDFGYTAADASQQRAQQQGFRGFPGFQGFDNFFGGGGGFKFNFNFNDFGGGESIIDKYRINLWFVLK